jgi:hypothetical protein
MLLLNTSLLRERFTIRFNNKDEKPFEAFGNRVSLPLSNHDGTIRETFVIRSQTMHTALRMAAAIAKEFTLSGPIINRPVALDYNKIWYDIIKDFEKAYNPHIWCAVYYKGKVIFKDGDYHAFLNVIEQCDIQNKGDYDRSVSIAKDMFQQLGRIADIRHQLHIAAVYGATADKIRCGLALRTLQQERTFKFTLSANENTLQKIRPYEGLSLAALYLEGIQLSILSGMGEATHPAPLHAIYKRIGKINQSILFHEKRYHIYYRPERPDFKFLADEARRAAQGNE